MNSLSCIDHGDFSCLANSYSGARPGYAPEIVDILTGLAGKSFTEMDVADIGAGTGIFSRIMAARGPRSIVAVEPNEDMRCRGIEDSKNTDIDWRIGSAEDTGLATASADILSMASSFHWVDFERGTSEFHRVLRPAGWFVSLWNPRYIEATPLLVEIEEHLRYLKPDMKRVSSGRSGLTSELTDMLNNSPLFDSVVYFEARHIEKFSHDRYIQAWQSVNDVQHQLGPARFEEFISWIKDRIAEEGDIDAVYMTRAWTARRK